MDPEHVVAAVWDLVEDGKVTYSALAKVRLAPAFSRSPASVFAVTGLTIRPDAPHHEETDV